MATNKGRKLAASQLLDALNGLDKTELKEYLAVMLKYTPMMAPDFDFPFTHDDLSYWLTNIKEES